MRLTPRETRQHIMAWLFLDESGHFSDKDYVCLAGFSSSDGHWDLFIPEWRDLLLKYGIPAVHMKDIMSPNGQSPAAGWPIEKKLEMLSEFIFVIRKYVKAGFGVGLKASHYRRVVKELEESGEIKKPFHAPVFCFARMVKLALWHTFLKSSEQSIEIVLDDSEQYAMKCYSYLSQLRKSNGLVKQRVSSITFADDSMWYPLQAADILAYAICNELKKTDMEAWKYSNVFSELLMGKDPAYGLLYHGELWAEGAENALSEAVIDGLQNVMNKTP